VNVKCVHVPRVPCFDHPIPLSPPTPTPVQDEIKLVLAPRVAAGERAVRLMQHRLEAQREALLRAADAAARRRREGAVAAAVARLRWQDGALRVREGANAEATTAVASAAVAAAGGSALPASPPSARGRAAGTSPTSAPGGPPSTTHSSVASPTDDDGDGGATVTEPSKVSSQEVRRKRREAQAGVRDFEAEAAAILRTWTHQLHAGAAALPPAPTPAPAPAPAGTGTDISGPLAVGEGYRVAVHQAPTAAAKSAPPSSSWLDRGPPRIVGARPTTASVWEHRGSDQFKREGDFFREYRGWFALGRPAPTGPVSREAAAGHAEEGAVRQQDIVPTAAARHRTATRVDGRLFLRSAATFNGPTGVFSLYDTQTQVLWRVEVVDAWLPPVDLSLDLAPLDAPAPGPTKGNGKGKGKRAAGSDGSGSGSGAGSPAASSATASAAASAAASAIASPSRSASPTPFDAGTSPLMLAHAPALATTAHPDVAVAGGGAAPTTATIVATVSTAMHWGGAVAAACDAVIARAVGGARDALLSEPHDALARGHRRCAWLAARLSAVIGGQKDPLQADMTALRCRTTMASLSHSCLPHSHQPSAPHVCLRSDDFTAEAKREAAGHPPKKVRVGIV